MLHCCNWCVSFTHTHKRQDEQNFLFPPLPVLTTIWANILWVFFCSCPYVCGFIFEKRSSISLQVCVKGPSLAHTCLALQPAGCFRLSFGQVPSHLIWYRASLAQALTSGITLRREHAAISAKPLLCSRLSRGFWKTCECHALVHV